MGLQLGLSALLVLLAAVALSDVTRPTRTVEVRFGQTRLADAALYANDSWRLSAAQCQEYLRDGVTVVRGALNPSVVAAVHADFVDRHSPTEYINGAWIESPVLLDVIAFSRLPAVASNVYACAAAAGGHDSANWDVIQSVTDVAARLEEPEVRVYRAHVSPRDSGWHYDLADCGNGDYPSEHVTRSLPRIVLPLAPLPAGRGGRKDATGAGQSGETEPEAIVGTVVYNQSEYAASMGSDERARYLRSGIAGYRLAEADYDYRNVTALPPPGALPGGQAGHLRALVEPKLWLGDVMILSTCLPHRGPLPVQPGSTLALTYAPAGVPLNGRIGRGRGDCVHGLPAGAVASGDCFLPIYPHSVADARVAGGDPIRLSQVVHSAII